MNRNEAIALMNKHAAELVDGLENHGWRVTRLDERTGQICILSPASHRHVGGPAATLTLIARDYRNKDGCLLYIDSEDDPEDFPDVVFAVRVDVHMNGVHNLWTGPNECYRMGA